jgi:hypothetical protein
MWLLAADFCLDDKGMINNTCAISLIPIDEEPSGIVSRIKSAIPKDLKKTRDITKEIIEALGDKRTFHFVFVLDGHRKIFGDPNIRQESATKYVQDMCSTLTQMGCPPKIYKPFKKLLQESKAKSFNVSLLADTLVFSAMISFVTACLIRESGAKLIGLFPDRDKIIEWCDGVYSDLVCCL